MELATMATGVLGVTQCSWKLFLQVVIHIKMHNKNVLCTPKALASHERD